MATEDRTTLDAEQADQIATTLNQVVHHFESIRDFAVEMEHCGEVRSNLTPAFLTSIQSLCLIGGAKADAVARRLGERGVGALEAELENWRGKV